MSASILVVDDEEDVADLFRRRFRREIKDGTYVFHFALSGEAALDMLGQQIRPEVMLILSDINMPGMTGLELLERIKAKMPSLPVVMVTAYGDVDKQERARRLDASEFLTKPIDFDALKRTVSSIVAD